MWTYIARRLLIAVPTLFGITLVCFGIMRMAPGDPLLSQMGQTGAQSASSETREQYQIRRKSLNLDKPIIINLRNFYDYKVELRQTAFIRGHSEDDLAVFLEQVAKSPQQHEPFLAFVNSLDIPDFDRSLKNPERRLQLARQIRAHTESHLVHTGTYGTPAGLELLKNERDEFDDDETIGLINSIAFMTDEANLAVYSRDPTEAETKLVRATWNRWMELHESELEDFQTLAIALSYAPLATGTIADVAAMRVGIKPSFSNLRTNDPGRMKAWEPFLKELTLVDERAADKFFRDMAVVEDNAQRGALYKGLRPGQMPFLLKRLNDDDAPLETKAIAALGLKTTSGEVSGGPLLQTDLPLGASSEEVNRVAENWLAHYEVRQEYYARSTPRKIYDMFFDTQYAHMVWRLATFQFGVSTKKSRKPVGDIIWDAFVVSAPLMVMSQLVIYFVSVPLGVGCAIQREKLFDRITSLFLFFLYSVPPFVAGMLLLMFLCYDSSPIIWAFPGLKESGVLPLFPKGGLHDDGAAAYSWPAYLLDYFHHAFLPVICLSLFSLAAIAMYARTSMLDVINQDYIRTARAKGASRFVVIFKHAFRNSLIPILTLFSNILPAMLGGSVLIEVIFNIPGMGNLNWDSIAQRDYPTLMALIYVQAIVLLVSILITDILYVFVDPRISFQGQGKR